MKKVCLSILAFGLFSLFTFGLSVQTVAQSQPTAAQVDSDDNNIVKEPEKSPSFPGGDQAMMSFISENIKYPKTAREQGVEGNVVIRFVVEKDGSVSNMESLMNFNEELEEEAMRVISEMPQWKPAEHEGEKVRTEVAIPIQYKIPKDK